MTRVIQDSDDELDDDLLPEEHQAGRDAPPKQSTGDASSTEALRKQIEAAHRAHLQSQSLVHDGQMPAPIEFNHSKIDITDETETNTTSNEFFHTPFLTDRAALADVLGSLPPSQQHNRGPLDRSPQSGETTTEAEWVLDGTTREAYAQHEPNILFPAPSSTIPNATITQQRMMEGLHAPTLLGSDVDTGGIPFEPVASIPWSEYLKSSTTTVEHSESFAREPHVSQTTSSMNLQRSNKGKVATSTQRSYRKDNCSSPRSISEDDLVDLGLPKEQYKPRPSRSRSLKVDTAEAVDYSVNPEKAIKAKKRVKSTPASTNPPHSLSTPNRVRQICEMGFTPSTSARALQKNNGDVTQTVDWLITNRVGDDELVPRTLQMSKATRSQPTASIDTPVFDDLLQEGGPSVKQLATIDVDASPDVTGTRTTNTRTDVATSVVDIRSPSKVQVIIPAKLPVSTGEQAQKGVKRRRTMPGNLEPMPTLGAVESAKVEKKRGRGRPKKATKDSASMASMQQGEDEEPKKQNEDHDLSSAQDAHPTPVQDQEDVDKANTDSTSSGQGIKNLNITSTKWSTPEPALLPDRPEVEPITPERVKKVAPREQPSSNRAKMTYRVGLSKRARIAPLLRTMRK